MGKIKKLLSKILCPEIFLLVLTIIFELCFTQRKLTFTIVMITIIFYALIIWYLEKAINISAFFPLLILSHLTICTLLFTNFRTKPELYPSDPRDYVILAKNIINYKTYGKKQIPDGPINGFFIFPSTYRPVGYPAFIALIFFIFRTQNSNLIILSQYVIYIATLIILWKFIKQVYGEKTANIFTVIYSFNIPAIFLANAIWSETLSQFLITLILYCGLNLLKRSKPYINATIIGISSGWLILTRPIFMIYIPIIFFIPAWRFFTKKKIFRAELFALGLLCIIPSIWAARNSILSKKLTLFATNGGKNIYTGNNLYNVNGRCAFWPPKEYTEKAVGQKEIDEIVNAAPPELKEVARESAEDERYRSAGIKWITQNPKRFTKIAISKIKYVLIPDETTYALLLTLNSPRSEQLALINYIHTITFWTILFIATLGILSKKSLGLLILTAPYLGMITLFFADSRFQIPLNIPISLLATHAILDFSQKVKKKKTEPKLTTLVIENTIRYVTLILFFIHFLQFKETIASAKNAYAYEKKRARAIQSKINSNALLITDSTQKGDEDNFIIKKYSEDKYIEAKLFYKDNNISTKELRQIISKKEALTADLDFFNELANFEKEFYLLYNNQKNSFPIFSIKERSQIENLTPEVLAEIGEITKPEKETTVFEQNEIDRSAELMQVKLFVAKGSWVTIEGKEKITIKPYTKINEAVELEIYFSKDFFENGIKIRAQNNPIPTNLHKVDIDKQNWKHFEPGALRLDSVTLLKK